MTEMTYGQLKYLFCRFEENAPQTPLNAQIIITEDSFTRHYTEEQRTYQFSSRNKAFMPNMSGYSIFGKCIDGTDDGIRLEQYLWDECGGENGWRIEKCFLVD